MHTLITLNVNGLAIHEVVHTKIGPISRAPSQSAETLTVLVQGPDPKILLIGTIRGGKV